VVRLDSTVTAALMHEPSDSSLLWDAVRVMVRLLREADGLVGRARLWWRDHRRAAKKRARAIQFTRGRPRRVQLYRELIQTARATLAYLQHAAAQLATASAGAAALWQAKVNHYRPLIERIIAQTERRVLAGEPVPASDKLVSLFEPHVDIIRKGREVAYGHKLNLTTGPQRPDPRPRHRSRQSGRQRAPAAHAGAPPRALWPAAAPGGRRRQLCQPGQSAPGQSLRHPRHGVPQEGRPRH
jgi:IS5 family transposase